MSVYFTIYLIALFFVLTPGVLVSLPPKSSKLTVAVTHAIVFAVIYQLTNKMVSQALEGFKGSGVPSKKKNNERCNSDGKAKDGGDSECQSGFCKAEGGKSGVKSLCSDIMGKNGKHCRTNNHCKTGLKCGTGRNFQEVFNVCI